MSEWVSVKDRLPELKPSNRFACPSSGPVLVWYYDACHISELLDFGSGGLKWMSCEGIFPVTHWMPLPEPPKDEQ